MTSPTPISDTVLKLDVPTQFAAIPTCLKLADDLSDNDRARHHTWHTHFAATIAPKDAARILWVGRHHPAIAAHIRAEYSKPSYSKQTLRAHLESLANILLAIDRNKYKEVARPLFREGAALQREVNAAPNDSKLRPAESVAAVSYPELVAAREKAHAAWMAAPTNLGLNLDHLILALNTLIPPLRLEWLSMRIWPPSAGTEPPHDGTNYLWQTAPAEWSIVLNHDKIEARRKSLGLARQVFPLSDELPGITDGRQLQAIIADSLKAAPRDYVLIGVRSKQPLSEASYDAILARLFKPRKPHQNLLRKAYISHWHHATIDGHPLSESQLGAIADRMRHSLSMARAAYRKIDIAAPLSAPLPVPPMAPPIEPAEVAPPLPASLPPPLPEPKKGKPQFNAREYSRKYRIEHLEAVKARQAATYAKRSHAIQRTRLLRNIVRDQSTPTPTSIAKYGLYQDGAGKWQTSQTGDTVPG